MKRNPVLCAAQGLRDALQVKMAECGASPCKIFLSPTPATVIDTCCECGQGDGQAWVSVITSKPLGDNTPCAVEVETMFVMGIARCAAGLDNQGNRPSAEELNADFDKLMRDYQIMREAFALYVKESDVDKQMYRFGDYDVHPVRGKCMAATHEFWLTLSACAPC